LQETATEPASTTAVDAASPRQESASQAGPVATAVADAVGGSQPSADSCPTAGFAAPRRLHVRASDQGFLPIEVEHYVMLLDWTGRELRADKPGAIPEHLAPIVERLGLNRSNWVETVRGFGRLFKQAAGRSSSLVDAAARRSRRWFQGKAAARSAFVYTTGTTLSQKHTSLSRSRSKSVTASCAQIAGRRRLDRTNRSTSHEN
jgi:hypothetical protein